MHVRERILVTGVTGSGKSYQWLKLAESLLPTGAKFRVIDTDEAIPYMLETQFPHLKPENKGNVYVYPGSDWKGLKEGLAKIEKENPVEKDWLIIDMADAPWSSVQRYFTSQVFDESMGEYFLQIRKAIYEKGGIGKDGKAVSSIVREGLSGWVDWVVINRLYEDWVLPIIYRIKCHVYAATKVQTLPKNEKDSEILALYGGLGIRPAGQKNLGHQMHTIFLFKPGLDKWFITTIKDRANRKYFKNVPFTSFFKQYLVVKAGWPLS